MTQAGHSMSKKNKRLILSIFASFLLVATIIAISMGINSHKNSTKTAAAHALLVTSGNSGDPHAAILNSINTTIDAIKSKKIDVDKILATKKPKKKQKNALNGCLQNYNSNLADLDKVWGELKSNPDNQLLQQPAYAASLTTQVSSCKTNQDSCIDGFSHSLLSRILRELLFPSKQDNVGMMCSTALTSIKKLIEDNKASTVNGPKSTSRKLKDESDVDEGWHRHKATSSWSKPDILSTSFLESASNPGDPQKVILDNINATINAINSKKIEADRILTTEQPEEKQRTALNDFEELQQQSCRSRKDDKESKFRQREER
ncbi:hypothetical protein DKX38_003699 [Salix brachista]|uniref:Pectinesterase inhibitor domain-containing protein n=1 Tax=Salix brachista TaxID=2182728 RepID=A0A5N5N8J2_9ROSI|nr:hypothetical protein DKX38_003699 [Salix brachista]